MLAWKHTLAYSAPQVAANQFLLAPVTLTTVFGWNLALTGK